MSNFVSYGNAENLMREINRKIEAVPGVPDVEELQQEVSALEQNLFLLAHPVGEYWWTSTNIDPNTEYGGTWEKIEGRFLMASSSAYVSGATGGASTVSLAASNLPAHSHTVSTTDTNHTHSGTTGTMNSNWWHNHAYGDYFNTSWNGETHDRQCAMATDSTAEPKGHTAGVDINHTHNFTTGYMSAHNTHSHTVNGGGNGKTSGDAFSVIPPYLSANCWHRIA